MGEIQDGTVPHGRVNACGTVVGVDDDDVRGFFTTCVKVIAKRVDAVKLPSCAPCCRWYCDVMYPTAVPFFWRIPSVQRPTGVIGFRSHEQMNVCPCDGSPTMFSCIYSGRVVG